MYLQQANAMALLCLQSAQRAAIMATIVLGPTLKSASVVYTKSFAQRRAVSAHTVQMLSFLTQKISLNVVGVTRSIVQTMTSAIACTVRRPYAIRTPRSVRFAMSLSVRIARTDIMSLSAWWSMIAQIQITAVETEIMGDANFDAEQEDLEGW